MLSRGFKVAFNISVVCGRMYYCCARYHHYIVAARWPVRDDEHGQGVEAEGVSGRSFNGAEEGFGRANTFALSSISTCTDSTAHSLTRTCEPEFGK